MPQPPEDVDGSKQSINRTGFIIQSSFHQSLFFKWFINIYGIWHMAYGIWFMAMARAMTKRGLNNL